ncbi:MAG TPA: hydantoinase/oxoprolinase family protein [Chloroflexota bacterium]|nr:hydantoinase/oxoprolinase family protein [Chloroflexota bacterium]
MPPDTSPNLPPPASARFRVGVDIGGTFTDLVLIDDATGGMTVGKTLTTAHAPAEAVGRLLADALQRARVDAADVRHVVHGTTLVTNAIIERKGARTALLTTRGFRDAYEIGREHRYDLYDLFLEMPQPLVPRHLRLEVDERTYADGTVARVLDEADARELVTELSDKGIEAIAVCLLHSYANPAHEQTVARIIEQAAPSIRVSMSSEVVPEIREYERTSTTVANVYVQGLVDDYLADLESRMRALGFEGSLFVMLSSGGIATLDTARAFPIRLLESGPAGGALAAAHYGTAAGMADLLAFDMGGTTAKLCLIEDGQPRVANDFEVDRKYRFKRGSGLPVKVPVVELLEIGAGGGSIARLDSLGLLNVGPESAGSEPGPACYGRGGRQPTVTDADLILGYLDEAFFLGGQMPLDRSAAEAALRTIAEPLGLSLVDAAWGVHQIANESMANAARVHAIERGRDPGSFPLFAFGGAGPVHAYGVARILKSPGVIAPFGAGVTSSVGFLTAPLAFDFVRSRYTLLGQVDWDEINAIYDDLARQGEKILLAADVLPDSIHYRRQADVRYAGQGHEVRIEIPEGFLGDTSLPVIRQTFRDAYVSLYGRPGPDVDLEVMTWRVTASGPRPELRLSTAEETSTGTLAPKGERRAYFPEWRELRLVPVYDRYALSPGNGFAGPAIVEERESTVIVGPGARACLDASKNLRIEMNP